MAVENTVNLHLELTGLGTSVRIPDSMSTTTTVATMVGESTQVQAVADTAEALNVGDVSTIELIWIHCTSNDVDIDCNYSSSFSADITIQEGEFAVFKPAGTVYIKNNDSAEQSTIRYIVWGSD